MKTEDISEFEKLIALNVNDKTEKKGKFTYLSWAWAWAEFVKIYPEATYEVVKNENGLPYFSDDTGGMVYTKVKAGALTHEMWLPIMDAYNKAKKQFDMMDVNKTVMRCLVKNLAMFGLGLYIYAGEDLPESEPEQPKEPERINAQQLEEIRKLIDETESDTVAFCKWLKVGSLPEIYAGHYETAINQLNKKLAEKVMG